MLDFFKSFFAFFTALVKWLVTTNLLKLFPPEVRPVVRVRQGKLRGVTTTLGNANGTTSYHFFKGIPYAKPPVGELRFRAPVEIDSFYHPVVDCLVDRSSCLQTLVGSFTIGKEAGLFLNVYTPRLPTDSGDDDAKLPVMVWIHGGGFFSGSSNSFVYDPIYLVQEGVVVVSMNYRLGIFGFLNLPGAGIEGNAGLKDQQLAFKWTKENISNFGGDPENITIFGESAGSMSAYLHYLSPNSRKYFNRVICQSGVACSESFFQLDSADKARKLAKILGYIGDDDKGVLETLSKAPASLLMKHCHDVRSDHERSLALQMIYRPVIEHQLTETSIVTETPEKILKAFDTIQMPLINGCTNSEGILGLRMILKRLDDFNENLGSLVPQLMGYLSTEDKQIMGKEIREFYFGDKKIDNNSLNEMCDLLSDNIFITNTMINAEWLAKYQPKVKHFHYRFNYDGRLSFCKRIFNLSQVPGACHSDDIFYLFKAKMLPNLSVDSEEYRIRTIMIRLWTNFAKYGDPTPDRGNEHGPFSIKWNPVAAIDKTSNEFNLDCLEIDVNPKMVLNPSANRIQLWRKYLQIYRKKYL